MRTAIKEDMQACVAELVYGEPLHIPGELLAASPTTRDPPELITQLRRHFKQLRPGGASLVPRRLRPQGSGGLYPRLPLAGCSTAPPGPTLQRPSQDHYPHDQDAADCHQQPTCHGVY
jgi:hypothetical protein